MDNDNLADAVDIKPTIVYRSHSDEIYELLPLAGNGGLTAREISHLLPGVHIELIRRSLKRMKKVPGYIGVRHERISKGRSAYRWFKL